MTDSHQTKQLLNVQHSAFARERHPGIFQAPGAGMRARRPGAAIGDHDFDNFPPRPGLTLRQASQ